MNLTRIISFFHNISCAGEKGNALFYLYLFIHLFIYLLTYLLIDFKWTNSSFIQTVYMASVHLNIRFTMYVLISLQIYMYMHAHVICQLAFKCCNIKENLLKNEFSLKTLTRLTHINRR